MEFRSGWNEWNLEADGANENLKANLADGANRT